MSGPLCFIIFVCLITIPTTTSYTILNRIHHELGNIQIYKHFSIILFIDKQRLLSNITQVYPNPTFNDCIPVQAVNQLDCPFFKEDSLHYELFKSICGQHQLCYACVSYQNKLVLLIFIIIGFCTRYYKTKM
jgi:hypothetical protein